MIHSFEPTHKKLIHVWAWEKNFLFIRISTIIYWKIKHESITPFYIRYDIITSYSKIEFKSKVWVLRENNSSLCILISKIRIRIIKPYVPFKCTTIFNFSFATIAKCTRKARAIYRLEASLFFLFSFLFFFFLTSIIES